MMRSPLPDSFLTIPLAHRGLHDRAKQRPENSAPAFRAAVAAGYGIELDLQASSDGVAMVFHDDDLDRLTGAKGPTRAQSAATLRRIALRDCAEPIPTLDEALALIGGRVPLLIELKDQSGVMGPTDGRLEQATALALKDYVGPVAVMSFNPSMVATMAHLAPGTPRGLTTYACPARDFPDTAQGQAHRRRLAEIADYDAVGADFVSHDWHDLGSPRITELKAQGARILSWTIKSAEQEALARRVAQNITFEQYLPSFP